METITELASTLIFVLVLAALGRHRWLSPFGKLYE